MRRILLPILAVTVLGSACQDNRVTTPAPLTEVVSREAVAQASTNARSSNIEALALALEDATARILPTLEDKALSERLNRQLTALSVALSAGREADARQQLANAKAVLRSRGEALSKDADLGAISLVLDQADTLIGGSTQ